MSDVVQGAGISPTEYSAPEYPIPHGHYPHGQYAPTPTQTRTNGFSIAALALGILWVWWVGSILALIFGYVAKSQIDRSHGTESGRGMAIAGIVLGWIGVGTLLLFFAFVWIGA